MDYSEGTGNILPILLFHSSIEPADSRTLIGIPGWHKHTSCMHTEALHSPGSMKELTFCSLQRIWHGVTCLWFIHHNLHMPLVLCNSCSRHFVVFIATGHSLQERCTRAWQWRKDKASASEWILFEVLRCRIGYLLGELGLCFKSPFTLLETPRNHPAPLSWIEGLGSHTVCLLSCSTGLSGLAQACSKRWTFWK